MRRGTLLLAALALATSGCLTGEPSPADIQALIIPHLSSRVNNAEARQAITNVLPAAVAAIRAGPPPHPPSAQGVAMAQQYDAGPWEIAEPDEMWERVSPDPGHGTRPPPPGE